MDMFEKASRSKLRFASTAGALTVEQLWDLPLTARSGNLDLDTVAKTASKALKDVTEESFVATRSNPQKASLELALELVKHVIAVKLEEAEATKTRVAKAARKAQLLEILEQKQTDSLLQMSREDILKELEAL